MNVFYGIVEKDFMWHYIENNKLVIAYIDYYDTELGDSIQIRDSIVIEATIENLDKLATFFNNFKDDYNKT